ncbi:MAG TPA: hypothetical protein VMV46_13255 [Thermoanaerobaculia bacterium]|nr:hypothetical protein [Thermoanaerobaculia bacterium]
MTQITPRSILERLERELEESAPERDDATEPGSPDILWRRLDEQAAGEHPPPADRLRARFYRALAEWQVEADRPPALARFEAWLAGFWPRRPLLQLATATAALGLGLLVGLAADRHDDELGALHVELRTMSDRVALGLLEGSSAADRLRGVALSSQALDDPRDGSQRIVDELLRLASADQSENVRLAAVEALARVADRPPVRRGLAASLGRQDSPVLQVAVADLLAERGGADGERALRELLAAPDLDPAVKARLWELIAARTGGTL